MAGLREVVLREAGLRGDVLREVGLRAAGVCAVELRDLVREEVEREAAVRGAERADE